MTRRKKSRQHQRKVSFLSKDRHQLQALLSKTDTPLLKAALKGHAKKVAKILKAGADKNCSEVTSGDTPLIIGWFAFTIWMLLGNGVHPSHYKTASEMGCAEFVQEILSAKADCNKPNKAGQVGKRQN